MNEIIRNFKCECGNEACSFNYCATHRRSIDRALIDQPFEDKALTLTQGIMKRLIWDLYERNEISMEVANLLLDQLYDRIDKKKW